VPKLSADEVTAFLREPGHLVRLATVDPDGAPRVVPIWFVFEDNRIWMTPRGRRRVA
jgi:nitroimidazol reductase NimA-like FMN-containing flavoprotein (pyridoxamine 5'-phosphate oxidase superfamily)